MNKIKILIVDDHRMLRDAWETVLNRDQRFLVVAGTGSAAEAERLLKVHHPAIVLLDINLPEMNGFDLAERIVKQHPYAGIIAVTLYNHPAYAKKMFRIGVKGYITKNSSHEELVSGIFAVSEGEKYMCEEIRNAITEQMILHKKRPTVETLTRREIEIIGFIRSGLSSKEIAGKLDLSAKTIEVHRYNILKKLSLRNTAALVNFINSSNFRLT